MDARAGIHFFLHRRAKKNGSSAKVCVLSNSQARGRPLGWAARSAWSVGAGGHIFRRRCISWNIPSGINWWLVNHNYCWHLLWDSGVILQIIKVWPCRHLPWNRCYINYLKIVTSLIQIAKIKQIHDRRYMNHMVLCNVALYKIEYLRQITISSIPINLLQLSVH